MEQGRLDWERAVARGSDPETSHEAAESVAVTRGQQIVLECFTSMGVPMADHEAYALPLIGKLSPSGFRSRRAELVAKGKLEFSGRYAVTPSGRKTRIWRVP